MRFWIGGFIVSGFALISVQAKDLCGTVRRRTFRGNGIDWHYRTGAKQVAASEAHSMILGAVALFFYAAILGRLVLRFRLAALPIFLPGLRLWLGVAVGLWFVVPSR